MKKYALALDLIDDAALIAEYEAYHKKSWPEITNSIIDSGILNMEIFRSSNRLFMLMETTDDFSFSRKREMDEANEKVQEWEALMWKFQQPLPWAVNGEKWILMDKIFELDKALQNDNLNG
ncbi:L-rhamnose mutarotase [Pedobacter sp. MC2016-05]|uniref:L-rhamnose mutarotase n=1 Tax=Pedobacter sp. MC2016-05 TaxID=2994474 RepID=UPI0022481640|nr:L-rhamnose mutarotase [Pedobacter sp. MC2016-05]MCX2473511.1 L-rhamnose mutarotase [Pedobacter sp. MC2016-05]